MYSIDGGGKMKQFLGVFFSTSIAFSADYSDCSDGYPSSPPDTQSEISSRPSSPSQEDEAVFTWPGLKMGDAAAISLLLDQNLTTSEVSIAIEILEELASENNIYAQELLVKCWIDGSLGLGNTQQNQSERLQHLWTYAENNTLVHRYLIESYMEGYFGISVKKKSRLKKARRFVLDHLDSPGVGDLVILALKENMLGFKSKREYLKHVKGRNGRWHIVPGDKTELTAIESLAEQHNSSAQAFLIECYMDSRYGADFWDKARFKLTLEKMEALDSGENPHVGVLILSVWQQNLLNYRKNRHAEYLKELRRLKEKYGHLYDDAPTLRNYNQFELLGDYVE
jgi:DNA polymerase IIIc chi subunit